MREGTLRVLEDEVFSIDNSEAFDATVERLSNLIRKFKGNPFPSAMSSASSMGQRVGIVYDARDNDRYDQLGNDETFPTSDDDFYPSWSSVSLPPYGLAPIRQRRATVDPSHEPLPQRPEKDKISESVMKKYNKIPAEERCYVRMKLDLLITLTLNIVKPQPKVREVLLAPMEDISTVI